MRDAVTAAVERRHADRRVGGQQRIGRAVPDLSGGLSRSDGRRRRRDGRRARHVLERGDEHFGLGSRRRLPSRRQRRRRRHRTGLGFRVWRTDSSSSATERPRRRRSSRASPRCCSRRARPHRGAAAVTHRAVRDAARGLVAQRLLRMGNRERLQRAHADDRARATDDRSPRRRDDGSGRANHHGERRRQLRVRQAHRADRYYLQAGEDESGRRIDRRARTALRRRRRTRERDGVQRRTTARSRSRLALGLPFEVRAERRRRARESAQRSEATSSEPSRRPTCTTSIA